MENYNVKNFGLNVIPEHKLKIAGAKVEEAMNSLWTPLFDYLDENENVFSGNISAQIEKMNLQGLELNSFIESNTTKHRFDEKG